MGRHHRREQTLFLFGASWRPSPASHKEPPHPTTRSTISTVPDEAADTGRHREHIPATTSQNSAPRTVFPTPPDDPRPASLVRDLTSSSSCFKPKYITISSYWHPSEIPLRGRLTRAATRDPLSESARFAEPSDRAPARLRRALRLRQAASFPAPTGQKKHHPGLLPSSYDELGAPIPTTARGDLPTTPTPATSRAQMRAIFLPVSAPSATANSRNVKHVYTASAT